MFHWRTPHGGRGSARADLGPRAEPKPPTGPRCIRPKLRLSDLDFKNYNVQSLTLFFGPRTETTTPHTLRHSYATHMLEEGVNIRLISAYLGHSSLETTMIYLHLTAVNEASARAAITRLLPPEDPEPPAASVPLPV